jgi:hypothetical protein
MRNSSNAAGREETQDICASRARWIRRRNSGNARVEIAFDFLADWIKNGVIK